MGTMLPTGEVRVINFSVAIPLDAVQVEGPHVARYVGLRLSRTQAVALKLLGAALRRGNVELANGRRVEDGAGVVRYLLERAGGELDDFALQDGT